MGTVFGLLFVARLPFLLTTLVIGFGVLLGIAQNGIPVGGAPAATALGIGIGVLGDDALIARVRKPA